MMGTTMRRALMLAATTAVATLAITPAVTASAEGIDVFVPSASVSGHTVTFPLHEGRGPDGEPTWFVVIEASDSETAEAWDVEVINKLENVGDGAQSATIAGGVVHFEGGVDFFPEHDVRGSATGFPPDAATPGSVGDDNYSPIVRLPNGGVINAPQVANATGVHDKVLAIDYTAGTVSLALTDGFARGDAVLYLSTDASAPDAAALEGSTFASRLARAPRAGDDSTDSGRASLAAFVNGPTGVNNRQRQGINSALLGEGDPLNILAWTPNQGRYSPLWDVHLSMWNRTGDARRITRFADVEDLAESGRVTGLGGSPWGPNDVVVNCPIIAEI